MKHDDDCRCPECALARRLAAWNPEDLEAAAPDHLVDGLWARLAPQLEDRPAPVVAPPPPPWWRRASLAWAIATVLLAVNAGLLWQLSARAGGATSAAAPVYVVVGSVERQGAAALPAGWAGRTVGEVQQWLVAVPAETVVLEANAARALGAPTRLAGVRLDDGLRAGEALALLRAFTPPPDMTLATLVQQNGGLTWKRS